MSIAIPPKLLCTPRLLRRGDLSIMEAFCSLGLTTQKLGLLNLCRLYLQVETLAGQALPSTSTLLWPRQGRPNSWATWRHSLATLFLRDTTITITGPWRYYTYAPA